MLTKDELMRAAIACDQLGAGTLAERLRAAANGQVMVDADLWADIQEFVGGYVDVLDGEFGPRPNKAMSLHQRMNAAAPGAADD